MHIISVAKALKNVSHIYISYTVPKKYKRRMHGNFKEVMFKQLSFSHLRLNTIGPVLLFMNLGKTNCKTAE